jgi:hypothetical protein
MEKIKRELYNIDIEFWKEFSDYLSLNVFSQIEMISNPEKSLVSNNLFELFRLLKFVIEKVNDVLETECNDSVCILNLLCIHSAILREFNTIMFNLSNSNLEKKSDFDKLSIEFIEIFNIFEDFLVADLSKVIITSFDRIDKLYLKIIQLI